MTYVWGFGVAKPVPGLRPQTVGADEDREGVRIKFCADHNVPLNTEQCLVAVLVSILRCKQVFSPGTPIALGPS